MGCINTKTKNREIEPKESMNVFQQWFNAINMKIHILNVTSSGVVQVLYRNIAAQRVYGLEDTSLFTRDNVNGILKNVVEKRKPCKAITRNVDQQLPICNSHSADSDLSSATDSNEISVLSESESMDSLITNSWYELHIYPLHGNRVVVVQSNINQQVQDIELLTRLTDINIDILTDLYPNKFKKKQTEFDKKYIQNYRQLIGRNRYTFTKYHENVGIMCVRIHDLYKMFNKITPGLITEYVSSVYQELCNMIREKPDLYCTEDSSDKLIVLSGLNARNDFERLNALKSLTDVAMSILEVADNYMSPNCTSTALSITISYGTVLSGMLGVDHIKYSFISGKIEECVMKTYEAQKENSIMLDGIAYDKLMANKMLNKQDQWVESPTDKSYFVYESNQ